jgi:hypothetical protein
VTRLAWLIASREGRFVPGSQPARKHNPGDLRHSPHSSHAGEGPNDIGIIDSDAAGWADEERQLRLYAARGLTLAEAIYEWAPPTENDSAGYLAFVLNGLNAPPYAQTPWITGGTPLSEVLEIEETEGA